MSSTAWPPDVARARALVMEHGWNATSYQIVNPGIRHWFSTAGDAVAGFVSYAGFRVIAGAPVCSLERLAGAVQELESDSRSNGEQVVYFGSEARLETLLPDSPSHSRALLGAQPSWNPAQWKDVVASHASLRAQLHRAVNKNIRVVEYSSEHASRTPELRAILSGWLATRGLPPLHFLIEPDTLARLDDRRIFVAEQLTGESTRAVAFAILSPIPARNGWLIEQFPRESDAPNGTVELLLATAAEAIASTGFTYVTLGLAPLARRHLAVRSEPAWLRGLLRFAAEHGKRFYNFEGLESFKAKFAPGAWEPVYAIQAGPRFTPRALYAIAGAFASRSPAQLAAVALARAARQEMRWARSRLSEILDAG